MKDKLREEIREEFKKIRESAWRATGTRELWSAVEDLIIAKMQEAWLKRSELELLPAVDDVHEFTDKQQKKWRELVKYKKQLFDE